MDTSDDLILEFLPYMRQYKSGRVDRLRGTEFIAASFDAATAVTSKDITINSTINLSARLYLPSLSDQSSKLPILVYFHGGAFITQSTTAPSYHNYLNSLAAKAGVLIVSVDYRRAPEHPLPVAHEDSILSLNWVLSQPSPDPWLAEHGDFNRLFIGGDSAGGNIAHYVALHADVNILGLAVVHPFFWGKEPVGSETVEPAVRGYIENLWRVVYPGMKGVDDPLINPLAPEAPSLRELKCKRVVVFVAGKDVLRERGRVYVEGLVASGWGGEAELVDAEEEEHVFHLHHPEKATAEAKLEKMAAFLKRE